MINENSDTWIVEALDKELHAGMRQRYKDLDMNWTRLMDATLSELSAKHDRKALLAALQTIPVDPHTLEAVLLAASTPNTEQRILSDANEWFIEAITAHLDISQHISTVVTNGSRWEEGGRILRVAPFHAHACPRCPANLCKGRVLDAWRADMHPDTRVIYVGDGGGEICPSLRLRPNDAICARVGFPLHDKLTGKDAPLLVGQLRPWADGRELLAHFTDALSNETKFTALNHDRPRRA
jgi:pyridoxal phosphate phosphatase PHOSPHO2